MDFASAIKTINKLLREKQPHAFNSSWIREYAPHIYRFIQKNVRTEIGGIDWARITRALDRKVQRKWITSWRNRTKPYRDKTEVGIILQKYHDKLYAFITPADKNDKYMRDIISIALVRLAQKGNIAQQEIIKLVRFTIDEWIERCPKLRKTTPIVFCSGQFFLSLCSSANIVLTHYLTGNRPHKAAQFTCYGGTCFHRPFSFIDQIPIPSA